MSLRIDPELLGTSALQPGPLKGGLLATSPSTAAPRGFAARLKVFFLTLFVLGYKMMTTTVLMVILLAVVLFAAERLGPIDWRPSTVIGAFAGHEQAAQLLTAIDAKRAEFAMEQEETARAQQEVLVVQANNERITKAYEALYQRGNLLAQEWARGATQILVLDTQGKLEALRGRAEVSARKDNLGFWCDVGNIFVSGQLPCDSLRQSAQSDRSAMSAEVISNYKTQSAFIASSLQDWAQGLPDPAQLVAAQYKIGQVYPLPRLPVPPAPSATATKS